MSDLPHWLRLTIRAGLREAHYHALMQATKGDTRPWDQGRYRRRDRRIERVLKEARALRVQAAVAANEVHIRPSDWRRVWKPLAFSNPVFTHTAARYTPVDLEALRLDWRAELKRLEATQPMPEENA
jgi:hypothetical protein